MNPKVAAWMMSAALVIGGVACSSSGSSSKDAASNGDGTSTTAAATTTVAASKPLVVVVTNDDGIGAPGIDEIARQLEKLPKVTVKVVAPATNQSGKGDSTTEGTVAHQTGKTASGIEGIAVDGTPADSVDVALDVLDLKPDLVVSGINLGQNVGPLTKVSGTIGAAMTAVRRGIPAVAGSAGPVDPDFAPAARFVIDWITANRAEIAAHTIGTTNVVNFNTPGCTSGKLHALVKVPTASTIPAGTSPFTTDCSATNADAKPASDVEAMIDGFAAQSDVPIR